MIFGTLETSESFALVWMGMVGHIETCKRWGWRWTMLVTSMIARGHKNSISYHFNRFVVVTPSIPTLKGCKTRYLPKMLNLVVPCFRTPRHDVRPVL